MSEVYRSVVREHHSSTQKSIFCAAALLIDNMHKQKTSRTQVEYKDQKSLSSAAIAAGFLHCKLLDEHHLLYLPEPVQTPEIQFISSNGIISLAFFHLVLAGF